MDYSRCRPEVLLTCVVLISLTGNRCTNERTTNMLNLSVRNGSISVRKAPCSLSEETARQPGTTMDLFGTTTADRNSMNYM